MSYIEDFIDFSEIHPTLGSSFSATNDPFSKFLGIKCIYSPRYVDCAMFWCKFWRLKVWFKSEYAWVYRVRFFFQKKNLVTSNGSKIITRHRMNMFLGVLERKMSILLKYVDKKNLTPKFHQMLAWSVNLISPIKFQNFNLVIVSKSDLFIAVTSQLGKTDQ